MGTFSQNASSDASRSAASRVLGRITRAVARANRRALSLRLMQVIVAPLASRLEPIRVMSLRWADMQGMPRPPGGRASWKS